MNCVVCGEEPFVQEPALLCLDCVSHLTKENFRLSDCRNEAEFEVYLKLYYGIDHVPTLEELQSNSVPFTGIDELLK